MGRWFYYGSSVNLKSRRGAHLRALKDGTHANRLMQRVYNKHQVFNFKVLVECPPEWAVEEEQRLITEHFDNPLCMNATSNALSSFRSVEQRKAISQRNKTRVWTEEARAKISRASSERKHDPSWYEKRRKTYQMFGNPNSRVTEAMSLLIKEKTEAGATQTEIAAEFGIDRNTVRRHQKYHGVKRKRQGWTEKQRRSVEAGRARNPNWCKRDNNHVRGENNPWATLNVQKVLDIRKSRGLVPAKVLAEKYNVSTACISSVWCRRSWAHVKPPQDQTP